MESAKDAAARAHKATCLRLVQGLLVIGEKLFQQQYSFHEAVGLKKTTAFKLTRGTTTPDGRLH